MWQVHESNPSSEHENTNKVESENENTLNSPNDLDEPIAIEKVLESFSG